MGVCHRKTRDNRLKRSQDSIGSDVLVALNSVDFSYADTPVYESLDLNIPRGGITGIMGPSGGGKSTLLSLIGGRLQPLCGNVVVDDVDVQSLDKRGLYHLRRRMGMLFQFNAAYY